MPPYYLTTPIYYANDAPHVGSAYTTVNADALARWHRLIGDEVTFLTGTDEHGAKIVEAAEAHGMSPQAWTDQTSARFVEAWDRLNISNDDFIRTTEPRHYAAVQQFLQQIYDNGFIKLAQYTGLYCVSCEDYYTPDQLIDGLCPVHGRPVIEMQEDNYFFTLSAFEQPLLDYYASHPDFVRPTTKRNEALGFIRGGLQDVSITRTSMQWGVPVPWDSGHVFYVWYDALINYLTAASYGTDPERFNALWGAAHHLIGKDILKFHCVWWPAMCMAAGISPPEEIFVHGYLLMGGQKLGKTLIQSGVVGEGDEARSLHITEVSPLALADEFGVDPLRYHLLRDISLGSDGDFSYEGIVARYNADLANNLGNLVSRVTTVVHSKCGGGPATGPRPGGRPGRPAGGGAGGGHRGLGPLGPPQDALAATWRLIGAANTELESTEPWKMDPGPEVALILGNALEVLRIVAILISAGHAVHGSAEIWRRIGLGADLAAVRLPADLCLGRATAAEVAMPWRRGAVVSPGVVSRDAVARPGEIRGARLPSASGAWWTSRRLRSRRRRAPRRPRCGSWPSRPPADAGHGDCSSMPSRGPRSGGHSPVRGGEFPCGRATSSAATVRARRRSVTRPPPSPRRASRGPTPLRRRRHVGSAHGG